MELRFTNDCLKKCSGKGLEIFRHLIQTCQKEESSDFIHCIIYWVVEKEWRRKIEKKSTQRRKTNVTHCPATFNISVHVIIP